MAGAQGRPGGGLWSSLLGPPSGARHERSLREEAMVQLERLGVAKFAGALPAVIPYGIAKKVFYRASVDGTSRLADVGRTGVGTRREGLDDSSNSSRSFTRQMSVLLVEHTWIRDATCSSTRRLELLVR